MNAAELTNCLRHQRNGLGACVAVDPNGQEIDATIRKPLPRPWKWLDEGEEN